MVEPLRINKDPKTGYEFIEAKGIGSEDAIINNGLYEKIDAFRSYLNGISMSLQRNSEDTTLEYLFAQLIEVHKELINTSSPKYFRPSKEFLEALKLIKPDKNLTMIFEDIKETEELFFNQSFIFTSPFSIPENKT